MATGAKVVAGVAAVAVVGGMYVLLAQEYGWDLLGIGRKAKEIRQKFSKET